MVYCKQIVEGFQPRGVDSGHPPREGMGEDGGRLMGSEGCPIL